MRLPGFTAEDSLSRTQGFKTVGSQQALIGNRSVQAQMVWPPGGLPGKVSICQIFPWLCVPPVNLCAHCGTNPECRCTCMGGYWNGYSCT